MGYKDLKFPENSRFLVTGGAGFIGSNLCEAILNMGFFVRCLDDFSTGKRENIAAFLENPNFELLGKNIVPNYGPDRAGDIKHSNADITKARTLLGYDPDYDFNRGIELAVDWYKENL